MTVGITIGLVVGVLLWWSSYVPSKSLFQNPQLVIVPMAIAILIVSMHNKWRTVGPYDPETIAQNKRGRV